MPGLGGSIGLKRVYDPPAPEDGRRILIDRLWPRGVSKAKAKIDFWAKECAPSTELRQWYQHDAEKWPEFKQRYFAELDAAVEGTAVALDAAAVALDATAVALDATAVALDATAVALDAAAVALDATAVALATLRREIDSGPVTFVFSSRETKLNNAAALVEYLDERRDPAAAEPSQ